MVQNDSDPEILKFATRANSIDEYLNNCHPIQLEKYCDFFEKARRSHAVRYLRVAICAHTLAGGGGVETKSLLGGTIPSTTEGMVMKGPCWDIL
jgi:hypothetical protein